jgi:hypothetical protein
MAPATMERRPPAETAIGAADPGEPNPAVLANLSLVTGAAGAASNAAQSRVDHEPSIARKENLSKFP